MKIKRDTYEEMWGRLEGAFNELFHNPQEDKVTEALDAILSVACIDVEPASVLPRVSDKLYPRKHDDRTLIFAEGRTVYIGAVDGNHQTEKERDAYTRLWCAAPKVVKVGVAEVRQRMESGTMTRFTRAIQEACKEAGAKI